MTTTERLNVIRARDLMRREVFKLEPTQLLEEAVTAFSEMHISGAPVVDRTGRLIGVLSAYDIARPENVRDGKLEPRSGEYALGKSDEEEDDELVTFAEDVFFSMEDYSPEVLESGTVADFMNPDVISVAPDAPLEDVCALMVKEHIHRVLVVENKRLVGIISSLDVARCVAEALAPAEVVAPDTSRRSR